MITQKILHSCIGTMLAILVAGTLTAGNLRINDQVKVVAVEDDYFTLSVSLSWENSWYDDYNFDAVWLFIKYRTAEVSDWTHLFLSPGGHQVEPAGSWLAGESGSENVGLFVWSQAPAAGKAALNCRVRCAIPYGVTKADVEQKKLYFAVQGIEMAYIPAGAFYLGDGVSSGTLCRTGGNDPVLVDSEDALTLDDIDGNSYSLTADYPKGYNGFFCMKNEISQKQYMDFLNLLSWDQQFVRINTYSMAEGSYIFSNSTTVANRNGIRLKKKSLDSTVPSIFINDLNGNGTGGDADDGQSVACNFLSAEDLYAYCAWAGLRPLAETEFEKAGRLLFPEPAVGGGYPWNKATGALTVAEADLTGKNTATEAAPTKNVNAEGGYGAPVRGGAFAGATAEQAGAGFWGVFGLAGNLWEYCGSVADEYFTSDCGDGNVGGAFWSGVVARGGSYNSVLGQLRLSDRSGITGVTDESAHQAEFGGRACRSVNAGSAGRIACADNTAAAKVCMGQKGQILSVSLPDNSAGVTYRWVMREDGSALWKTLAGETAATLEYEPATRVPGASKFYFRRIAHSRMGDLLSNEVQLTFINNDLQLTCARDTVTKCGEAEVIEASHHASGTISWSVGGNVLLTQDNLNGTGYLPDRSLGAANAETLLVCRSVIDGCAQEVTVPVFIAPAATDPTTECWACGDPVKDDAGNTYATVATPDGRCWMQENLRWNVTDSYLYTGADPAVYGQLYTWAAAMGGKDFEGAKGICPKGWYIPTYSDWLNLIDALGGNTVAGSVLQGLSALRLQLGGGRNAGVGNFVGFGDRGDYWSSTKKESGMSFGITIRKDNSMVDKYEGDIGNAVSVRCIKK